MNWNGWDHKRFDKPDIVWVSSEWHIAICKRAAWGGREYYKILEQVTPDGMYIEWDGLYDIIDGAISRIVKVMSGLPWSN